MARNLLEAKEIALPFKDKVHYISALDCRNKLSKRSVNAIELIALDIRIFSMFMTRYVSDYFFLLKR